MNTSLHPCLAIIIGSGAGMLLSVAGQKFLNQHYAKTCPLKPTHQLVMVTGFLGDTSYCIHKKYI